MPVSSSSGDNTVLRAAASSIANGIPSSRRHSSVTVVRTASVPRNARVQRHGALDEQLDRGRVLIAGRERWDDESPFAVDVETLSARGQEHRSPWSADEALGQRGAVIDDVSRSCR